MTRSFKAAYCRAFWEARRERLELLAIHREMPSGLVDNFEQVIAEGPNAQEKDLLRQSVKKVLVHDRRTIEIWYGIPNTLGFEHWNKNLKTALTQPEPSGSHQRTLTCSFVRTYDFDEPRVERDSQL